MILRVRRIFFEITTLASIDHRDESAFLKSFTGDDDILAGVTMQQDLVDGLMKLLKINDASVDKVTGLVEQLMGDNAKLLKLLAEKEGGHQLEDLA